LRAAAAAAAADVEEEVAAEEEDWLRRWWWVENLVGEVGRVLDRLRRGWWVVEWRLEGRDAVGLRVDVDVVVAGSTKGFGL
jgi:hypothetical protein